MPHLERCFHYCQLSRHCDLAHMYSSPHPCENEQPSWLNIDVIDTAFKQHSEEKAVKGQDKLLLSGGC